MERMILLTEALKRYHIRNDEYPPTLMDLHPEFLADSRTARCPLDTAPPRKTSYEYIRPKPDAPSDTVVIRCRLHASLAEGESSIVEVTLAGNVGTRSIPTPEVTKT